MSRRVGPRLAPLPLMCSALIAACAAPQAAAPGAIEPVTPAVAAPAAASPGGDVVARVDGVALDAGAVARHSVSTGLSRDVAVEDLIDFTLTRAAVQKAGIEAPAGSWSREERVRIELALARALSLDIPPATDTLTVDHTWVKDAPNPKLRARNRALLEKLRAEVERGALTMGLAFKKLVTDGTLWHIGDHEEYAYEVVPAAAHDLPPGSLSAIIPGDGGLHLFRIHARRKQDPPVNDVRAALSARLRQDATIERPGAPAAP